MKRIIALLAVFTILITASAFAESDVLPLDDMLFADAKESLVLFEAGDYAGAAELLSFGSADEFEKFITGNYLTIGQAEAQTQVSVAWWNGSAWMVAVPLYAPSSPEVETLVLVTNNIDCASFCGYMYAKWSDIETALSQCDYVIWNEEYVEEDSMIIYMDD